MSALAQLFDDAITRFTRTGDDDRRERIRRNPIQPISHCLGNGGTVHIQGTVIGGPYGSVTAPFSRRPIVWGEAAVLERRSWVEFMGDPLFHPTAWALVWDQSLRSYFLVNDGTGGHALITFERAHIVVPDQDFVCEQDSVRDFPPHVVELLEREDVSLKKLGLLPRNLRAFERVIAPGDVVNVMGPGFRDPSRGGQLVMAVGNGPSSLENELMVWR